MRHILAITLLGTTGLAQTWALNPSNGREYAITTPLSWSQAEAQAVSNGAHLATIRSATEEVWIVQTFGSSLWIGYTDAAIEGQWTWTSGESATYSNWCQGEPNNASNEDYGQITPCNWNDADGLAALPGLMERPSSSPQPGVSWIEQFPLNSPPARDTHGMTYEPVSQKTVLFGGYSTSSGQLADTWELDSTGWIQRFPQTSPSARETFAMCPDGSGGVLLFGGYSFNYGLRADTWRYSNGNWTQLSVGQGPPPRRYTSMALSTAGPLLFGGHGNGGPLSDTWLWNGTQWIQQSVSNSPSARVQHRLSFDSTHSLTVLFGGRSSQSSSSYLADVWTWNGTAWSQAQAANGPAPRSEASFSYSVVSDEHVLFGGQNGASLGDTWTWNGTTWTQQQPATSPAPRHAMGMAYDTARDTHVMFGGRSGSSLSDTWWYGSAGQASYSQFGIGCPDPNGATPHLAGVVGAEPRIGTTTTVRASNLPIAVTVPIFVFGTSNAVDPGPPTYALPLDLGILGWPGCQQLVSDDASFLSITNTGQADYSINVPLDFSLVGYEFHVQAFVLFTPSGVAVSNGVTGVVGF